MFGCQYRIFLILFHHNDTKQILFAIVNWFPKGGGPFQYSTQDCKEKSSKHLQISFQEPWTATSFLDNSAENALHVKLKSEHLLPKHCSPNNDKDSCATINQCTALSVDMFQGRESSSHIGSGVALLHQAEIKS